MKDHQLFILAIKLDYNLDIDSRLHWFDEETIVRIKSYYSKKDQLIAFTSALVKFYYLAKILDIQPSLLKINYTTFGRPFIANSNLDFNLSHSEEYLVFGVSNRGRIGIDIERLNLDISYQELSKLVFSNSEQKQIDTIDKFYLMWTKKEALIKAIGNGFSDDYYKTTQLTLQLVDITTNYVCYSCKLTKHYYLSICIML